MSQEAVSLQSQAGNTAGEIATLADQVQGADGDIGDITTKSMQMTVKNMELAALNKANDEHNKAGSVATR